MTYLWVGYFEKNCGFFNKSIILIRVSISLCMSVLSIATGIMKSKLFKFFETRVFNFGMKQPLGKIGGVFQTSLTSHSYAMNFEFFSPTRVI